MITIIVDEEETLLFLAWLPLTIPPGEQRYRGPTNLVCPLFSEFILLLFLLLVYFFVVVWLLSGIFPTPPHNNISTTTLSPLIPIPVPQHVTRRGLGRFLAIG